MKENPLKNNNHRVNFSYNHSPCKIDTLQDNSSLISLDRITCLHNDTDQFLIKINNHHPLENNNHSVSVPAHQANKKDVSLLPGVTLRKSFKKKDRLDFGE